jgi:hypothetical protein
MHAANHLGSVEEVGALPLEMGEVMEKLARKLPQGEKGPLEQQVEVVEEQTADALGKRRRHLLRFRTQTIACFSV